MPDLDRKDLEAMGALQPAEIELVLASAARLRDDSMA
jgi:hypothetical protein